MKKVKKIISILLEVIFVIGFVSLNNTYSAKADTNNNNLTNTMGSGEEFAIVTDSNGDLFSWGLNNWGQLGDGTKDNNFLAPKSISLGKNVKAKQIASSKYHLLAIGNDENLYSWGCNIDGQLGNDSTTSSSTPVKISLGDGIKPLVISCSDTKSMAIGSDGNLYAWGDNAYGELGLENSINEIKTPTKVSIADGVKPVNIICGNYFSLVLCNDGNLYVAGSYGQTSNYNFIKINLNINSKLVQVVSSGDIILVLCEDGNIYSWDKSDCDVKEELTPEKINLDEDKTPLQISMYNDTSAVLCSDGSIYAWKAKELTSPNKLSDLPDNVKPVEINCGSNNILAKGSNGCVYGDGDLYFYNTPNCMTNGEFVKIDLPQVENSDEGNSDEETSDEETSVTYSTHVQKIGWQNEVKNGEMAGTEGKSLRLEGIKIKLDKGSYTGGIEYRTHVQSKGWMDYVENGEISGTVGESKRLEAICIELYGDIAKKYDVYYRVHVQHKGWLDWAKDGEVAGTVGYGLRLEGIEIKLVNKDDTFDQSTDKPSYVAPPTISYRTHVQKQGYQSYVSNGQTSGTTGKGLRLEAIDIKTNDSKLNVDYSVHVQKIGWQSSVSNGALAGTTGKGLRLEAIKISLSGEDADKYDIYYRVHAEHYGWLGWACNGEVAGTEGLSKRLEAIEIKIVSKDDEEDVPDRTTPSKYADILSEAYKYLGCPYKWGASGPDAFDCSGFTYYVYKQATGIDIGRDSYSQINAGREVYENELKPGDLVFPHQGHVGIYVGNGMMIDAPGTDDYVKIRPVYKFWRARRILY